jgi:hypothetical protein
MKQQIIFNYVKSGLLILFVVFALGEIAQEFGESLAYASYK